MKYNYWWFFYLHHYWCLSGGWTRKISLYNLQFDVISPLSLSMGFSYFFFISTIKI